MALMRMPISPPGRVILLNGTSSSGKSSVAAELLAVLDEPYFHLSVDVFNSARAKRQSLGLDSAALELALARTRAGFHRAVAGMAQAGNNVVADYVFSEQWRLLDCLDVMAGLDVVFVGIRCSPDELRRREHARGDRQVGQAAAQLEQVHAHAIYDIECDTTTASPVDCAMLIKDFLASDSDPMAFAQLRALSFATETNLQPPDP